MKKPKWLDTQPVRYLGNDPVQTLLFSPIVTAARQDLCERAFRFAAAVLERYAQLAEVGPAQAHMTQQLFRSVSAIGANLEEGKVASSRRDMAAKYAIALREARETHHWLRLLATRPEWTEELAGQGGDRVHRDAHGFRATVENAHA